MVMLMVHRLCSIAWFLLAASATAVSSHQRESLSFDFGWRHRAGLHDWPTDPYEPPPFSPKGYLDPGDHPEEAQAKYIECDWIDVQLPHDGIISNPFGNEPSQKACPDGCSGRSYIPRHVLWYRKQFVLPPAWESAVRNGRASLFVNFEGSFRNTTVYWNGNRVHNHDCGYTPFRVELTREGLLLLDHHHPQTNKTNRIQTMAVFVDPDNGDSASPERGSGWWYEGGGLYRHVVLEKIPKPLRIAHDGVVVRSKIVSLLDDDEQQQQTQSTTRQLKDDSSVTSAAAAVMELFATVEITDTDAIVNNNNNNNNDGLSYAYDFEIETQDGSTIHRTPMRGLPSESGTIRERWKLFRPKLWTSTNPHLYSVTANLYAIFGRNTTTTKKIDSLKVPHGIRNLRFDANKGVYWNDQPYKIRGFCDHDTFAVVGMAMADRIHLFRAQASRSIGGNSRRASHNPPDPSNLDIYDRLGMLVINENRLFDNNTAYIKNMGDLVTRDRNHPSVAIWSFCNEVGCEGTHEKGGPAFQNITTTLDGTRPTLANMFTFGDLLSNTIDIQGFSHESRDKLDECHARLPNKPIVMSECCSCNTMRDEDEGCETMSDNPHTTCNQKAFNARCLERLVNASDGTEYASGTFVWTLFDYYGEPPSRPLTVSSTYGQFDLCGFPKASAYWFKSQWGSTSSNPFVYIVESWESPDHWNETKGNKTKTIHVYSNIYANIELTVNHNKSVGHRSIVHYTNSDRGSYAEFLNVEWSPGALTAMAYYEDMVYAEDTRYTNTGGKRLVLTLDSPSPKTGTGDRLFLDGHDVALVRATIVDDNRQRRMFANDTVSFRIVSGPGIILGTANGDPKSYHSHTSHSMPAHHGLVRAVIRVTSIAGLSPQEKELLQSMETTTIQQDNNNNKKCPNHTTTRGVVSYHDTEDIVVEATAPGIKHPKTITIPTSTNPAASARSVASRVAGRAVDFFA